MKIESESDIKTIINLLKSHDECLAIMSDHTLVCGVYWDENHQDWVFNFNQYLTFRLGDDRMFPHFSAYGIDGQSPTFNIRVLRSSADLTYEMRRAIVTDCLMSPSPYLKELLWFVHTNLGRVVMMDDDGVEYLLVGASSTLEDYYYVLLRPDLRLHFVSCVGKLDIKDWTLVGNEMRALLNRPDLTDIITDLRLDHFTSGIEEVEMIGF